MLNLLRHEIQSRFGAIIGWGIGLIAFGSMYISIFPEVGEEMASLADPGWSGSGVFDSGFENWLRSFQRRQGLIRADFLQRFGGVIAKANTRKLGISPRGI